MYKNLREFINTLDRAGELKTVTDPVSPYLTISRYTDIESKAQNGGKALLFKNVLGSDFPVATNIFGSPKRICMALGVESLDQLGDHVRDYLNIDPPKTLTEALALLPMGLQLTRFFPRTYRRKTPPCQEVVHTGDAVNLKMLPILHCWPKDGGPFITLPLVITRSLVTNRRNVGMYRLQVFDKNTTGMHWHVHKDGSHYYDEYEKADKRMPVAVAIGADPVVTYAATAPLPRGIDEMLLAGFIRNKPVRMAKCLTVDMEVPAEAEFVLEGYVDPKERRLEGPFGDHTGYYSPADMYPVFHVTAVTHRKNSVYNATLVGRPPMEDCYLAKATERLFLPLLQMVMPEVTDYCLPWEGVFHNIVVVAIDKAYPGHAHKIINGLWGQGQMSFCKCIVVVDADIDPKDFHAVPALFVRRFDPAADRVLSKGVLDVLDHAAPHANFGHKLGIDLTRRIKGEPPRTPAPKPGNLPETEPLFTSLISEIKWVTGCRHLLSDLEPSAAKNTILAVTVRKNDLRGGSLIARKLLGMEALRAFHFILLYDDGIDLSDDSLILWKLFNNVDPGRDIHAKGTRLAVDACKKLPVDGHDREWPDDLTFDVDQVAKTTHLS